MLRLIDDHPDALIVARAMALLWVPGNRTRIGDLISRLGWRTTRGTAFQPAAVTEAVGVLREAGWLVEGLDRGLPVVRLQDEGRIRMYRDLLGRYEIPDLTRAIYKLYRQDLTYVRWHWPFHELEPTIAAVRLEFLSGASHEALLQLAERVGRVHDWADVLVRACIEGFDPELHQRIDEGWRNLLANLALNAACTTYRAEYLPMCRWVLAEHQVNGTRFAPSVRLYAAMMHLLRGEQSPARKILDEFQNGVALSLQAVLLAQDGEWEQAQSAFETAFRQLQEETGRRKNLVSPAVSWLYPLALLAQPTPKNLKEARRFCLAESGSTKSAPDESWGLWAHAVAVRLGDAPLDRTALVFRSAEGFVDSDDLWRSLLRTWLGSRVVESPGKATMADREDSLAALRQRFADCGFVWLDEMLVTAERVFEGGDAPEKYFAQGSLELWRTMLASLEAIADDASPKRATRESRLVWVVTLGRHGEVDDIEPMEQKKGARAWNLPKPVPLSRLTKAAKLDPRDADVVRTIRQERRHAARFHIDLAAAMSALIGHPRVVLHSNPLQSVEVAGGTASLEVERKGESFRLVMHPAPRRVMTTDVYAWELDAQARRELDDLSNLTVEIESPGRIRVIRFTPAQRRVAQLLSEKWSVPVSAERELQTALEALTAHFDVHSDQAVAAFEVETESRLRAEVSPAGDGIRLRLVVAPLGPDGPRLTPGTGRKRVMASVAGESIATTRDLEAERTHVDSTMAAIGFLDDVSAGRDLVFEWTIDDPESALALLERLPTLSSICSIDWPKGAPVRVISVDTSSLSVRVRTERDWFSLDGGLTVDEGLVLELSRVIAAGRTPSRFIPMGDGIYAALSRDLHEKAVELAAIAEMHDDSATIPHAAAAWLEDVLDGAATEADSAFELRIRRLETARDLNPTVPKGLLTSLRPYQEDGFVWAMRLAEASFGACLADDMGLGKTIQALAVLLARAAGGPALVVAPTSVCGNWAAETRRFAPSLTPILFGEGDRESAISSAGPGDLLIVSYTLMQQAQESFAARTWFTLVADEAQSVKNALAKRSVALFALSADFRMALSGTPIENRLSELWSIMRYCNPGLLGTAARFQERFATPIERERNRDAQRRLKRLIAPFVLRRTKAEVLQDLPPRTELVMTVVPEPAEAAHYEALRREAIVAAERLDPVESAGQAKFHILALLTRLRRAACDPRLVTPGFPGVGAKVQAFAELAVELTDNGHKALVFSQFVDFLTLLRAPLDEAGITYQYLDGSTPAAERTRRVAAFQAGDSDLFLISLKAGGYGLNLTAADYVVITDPWWNPAAEDQAMGRAHRIGQARPVTVYRLVRENTLEERIIELHRDKRDLAEGILSESGSVSQLPEVGELIALMRGE